MSYCPIVASVYVLHTGSSSENALPLQVDGVDGEWFIFQGTESTLCGYPIPDLHCGFCILLGGGGGMQMQFRDPKTHPVPLSPARAEHSSLRPAVL